MSYYGLSRHSMFGVTIIEFGDDGSLLQGNLPRETSRQSILFGESCRSCHILDRPNVRHAEHGRMTTPKPGEYSVPVRRCLDFLVLGHFYFEQKLPRYAVFKAYGQMSSISDKPETVHFWLARQCFDEYQLSSGF